MPFYEFQCNTCGTRQEVFTRSMNTTVTAPPCTARGCAGETVRVISKVLRRLTDADQMADAEARWGKEVNDVLGPGPDIGRHVRRYDALSKDLPNKNDL